MFSCPEQQNVENLGKVTLGGQRKPFLRNSGHIFKSLYRAFCQTMLCLHLYKILMDNVFKVMKKIGHKCLADQTNVNP